MPEDAADGSAKHLITARFCPLVHAAGETVRQEEIARVLGHEGLDGFAPCHGRALTSRSTIYSTEDKMPLSARAQARPRARGPETLSGRCSGDQPRSASSAGAHFAAISRSANSSAVLGGSRSSAGDQSSARCVKFAPRPHLQPVYGHSPPAAHTLNASGLG